jgi:hypothetical protein
MPFENLSPGNREAALALTLRGRRLIFEIGLDEDWYESAANTFRNPIDGGWRFGTKDLRRYPATLAVLLAAAGTLHYREGNLWSHLDVSGPKAVLVGRAFLMALRVLRLETFDALVEDERALRYLTPILAHGGIPRYCLSDFFRLLVRTVRQGSIDPPEILSLWATRKSLTQGVDKPAIRFILHGGEPAADFLQRCVDLVLETRRNGHVPAAAELGLPDSLVQAFASFENEVKDTVTRDPVPRPSVQLDPWDGLGPTVELPPADAGVGSLDWRLRDERHTASYRSSRALAQTIRLNPARHWEVECQAIGREPRTFVFDCFDPLPALFFDPSSGRLWRGRDQLRLESVWTLHNRDVTLSGIDKSGNEVSLVSVEGLPQPSGVWSGCQLSHYRLDALRYVIAKGSDGNVTRIAVAPPARRPLLSSGLDPMSARSLGGAFLYPRVPTLTLPEVADVPWDRWRITARSNDSMRNITADKLPFSDGSFSLEPLLRDWTLQEIQLAVRGPLGSDLSALFAVVPGLVVERPEHVLLPTQHSQIRLKCDTSVRLGPNAIAGSVTLHVGQHIDHIRCPSSLDSDELTLLISVPRLKWALSRSADAGVTTASTLIVIDMSELLESRTSALVVSAGISDVHLRLRLLAGSTAIQASDWVSTSASGRVFFDLARFRDTVAQSEYSSLEFALDLGNRSVPVARLVTKLEVTDISGIRVVENGMARIECRFTDARGMKNREVRFWSVDRPWDDAIAVPAPDDAGCVVLTSPGPTPSAGRYLVEVSLSDPWNRPVRPRPSSPNTALLTLGSPVDIDMHRATLDTANPLAAVECAISTGRASRPLTEPERNQIAVQAVEAACYQLGYMGIKALHARSFHYVTECFAGSIRSLAWSSSRAIEEGRVTDADLLRLAIAVIPLLKVAAVAEADTAEIGVPIPSDSMLRDLWSTCPPIAAVYDVATALANDGEAIDRCEEFLGVRPGSSVSAGAPIGTPEWQLSTELLRHVRHAMELKPVRLLDLDALAEANFEWILAEREGRIRSTEWCLHHDRSLGQLPALDANSFEHLTARRPSKTLEEGMKLSRGVLRACLHLASSSPRVELAVQALLPLVEAVPRMLARDLTLAIVLVATAPSDTGSTSKSNLDA